MKKYFKAEELTDMFDNVVENENESDLIIFKYQILDGFCRCFSQVLKKDIFRGHFKRSF